MPSVITKKEVLNMYEQKLAYEGIFDVVMKEANSPFYKNWFASEYAPENQNW